MHVNILKDPEKTCREEIGLIGLGLGYGCLLEVGLGSQIPYVEVLTTGPQIVTVFGDRAFKR